MISFARFARARSFPPVCFRFFDVHDSSTVEVCTEERRRKELVDEWRKSRSGSSSDSELSFDTWVETAPVAVRVLAAGPERLDSLPFRFADFGVSFSSAS